MSATTPPPGELASDHIGAVPAQPQTAPVEKPPPHHIEPTPLSETTPIEPPDRVAKQQHRILKSLLAFAMATVIPSSGFEIRLQDEIRANNSPSATKIEHYFSPELASKQAELDREAERLPKQYDTCWYGFDGFGSNRWQSIDEALAHLLVDTTNTKISGVHYGYDKQGSWIDTISQELDKDTADCKTISFAGVSLGAITAITARMNMKRDIPIKNFVIFNGPARQSDVRHPGAVSVKENTGLPITAFGLVLSKVWDCGFDKGCYIDRVDRVTHGAPTIVQNAQASLLANASSITSRLRDNRHLFARGAQALFIIPRQPKHDPFINPERSALSWQEALPVPFSMIEADGSHGSIYSVAHSPFVEYVFRTTGMGGLIPTQRKPARSRYLVPY